MLGRGVAASTTGVYNNDVCEKLILSHTGGPHIHIIGDPIRTAAPLLFVGKWGWSSSLSGRLWSVTPFVLDLRTSKSRAGEKCGDRTLDYK